MHTDCTCARTRGASRSDPDGQAELWVDLRSMEGDRTDGQCLDRVLTPFDLCLCTDLMLLEDLR